MYWRDLETFSFEDGPEMAEWLAGLVLKGRKTATCWAASEPTFAEVGKLMVMLDGAGNPRAVLETVELIRARFNEVDEQFAFDEGEGDRTLSIGGMPTKDTLHAGVSSLRICSCGVSAFGSSR